MEQQVIIIITGRGGLQGCEMLKIPHYPYNRLTDSEVISFSTGRALLLRSIYWYTFMLETVNLRGQCYWKD
jgi:hypothetical protein